MSDEGLNSLTIEPTSGISRDLLKKMHLTMLTIRKFEEVVGELVAKGEIICPCHLYIGQEAVAAGACAALNRQDWVFSNHRSHGHYLAKGGDINTLMAELFGKITGCSRGRGGSMHLSAPDMGLPGSSAIVAGVIPLAVGAGLGFTLQGKSSISVVFFGDGAVDEGTFYESLNFAALRKLPVLFICENNFYSTHMPLASCLADTRIYRKAEMFNMSGIRVEGNDVIAVYKAVNRAVISARSGQGPTLIECSTYRWRGHVGPSNDIDQGLRNRNELDYWMDRCPIRAFEEFLIKQGVSSPSQMIAVYSSVEESVTEAVTLAKASPLPVPDKNNLLSVFKGQI